jgi:hypothetical protein
MLPAGVITALTDVAHELGQTDCGIGFLVGGKCAESVALPNPRKAHIDIIEVRWLFAPSISTVRLVSARGYDLRVP